MSISGFRFGFVFFVSAFSLEDLKWCQDQIMPANPAYLMALPTRNDPMLSYLSTSFQDHVRIREKFNFKINDPMWEFFKKINIIDENNKPTKHFGDPIWVYYQFRLSVGDKRDKKIIVQEGKESIKGVESRGVPISIGHGKHIWDLNPKLNKQIKKLYQEAKKSIWSEFSPDFISSLENKLLIKSQTENRNQYIGNPEKGEKLSEGSLKLIKLLDNSSDIQIIISDGLNANSIMKTGHLNSFLKELNKELKKSNLNLSKTNLLLEGGRVRAGYQTGEIIFKVSKDSLNTNKLKSIVHIIGERPGNGHDSFSAYISTAYPNIWAKKNSIDHDQTRLISGISNTSLKPKKAAKQTALLIEKLVRDYEKII